MLLFSCVTILLHCNWSFDRVGCARHYVSLLPLSRYLVERRAKEERRPSSKAMTPGKGGRRTHGHRRSVSNRRRAGRTTSTKDVDAPNIRTLGRRREEPRLRPYAGGILFPSLCQCKIVTSLPSHEAGKMISYRTHSIHHLIAAGYLHILFVTPSAAALLKTSSD